MTRTIGIIPARYASTRFPGKPLAMIGKKPMIQWVFEAAKKARELDELIVATDDERIFQKVMEFGGKAMMTSPHHNTGSDRLVEAAAAFPDCGIVLNIQGDEPGLESELIDGIVALKKSKSSWPVTTAARPFQPHEDKNDPNRVKVVVGSNGRALYFSRSPIPYFRNEIEYPTYLHLGLYAYDREFLFQFPDLPESNLEKAESLEQLRILDSGFDIGVHIVQTSTPGVDTPKDLEQVSQLFRLQGLLEN